MRNLTAALALIANLSLLAGCSGQAIEGGDNAAPVATQSQRTTEASSLGWTIASDNEPTGRGAVQGASADLPDSTQALLFGGLAGDGALLDDARLYGDSGWLAGDRTAQGSARPEARAYGSVSYHGATNPGYVLFGGFAYSGALDDVWHATVGADQSVTWKRVEKADGATWPSKRFLHGVAVMGDELVVFGGVDSVGNPLSDMWKATVGGTAEAPAVSWSKVCGSCVPARYGATPIQVKNTDNNGVFLIGGYSADGLTDTVYQWNESLTEPTWTLKSFKSAVVPTAEDGSPVLSSRATADQSSPRARYVGFATHDADGNLFYGGGVDLDGDSFRWISDAWILDRREGADRWSRFAVSSTGHLPGGRESPLALPLYKNGATAGMLFFGGSRDGAVQQQTRTTSSVLGATSSVKVHSTTQRGVTSYRLNAMNAGANIAGYGVYRLNGVWNVGSECGSPEAPLVTDPGSCELVSLGSGDVQPDAFAWVFRDERYFYGASTGEAGKGCVAGTDLTETCNPRSSFPGQAEAALATVARAD